MNRIAVALTLVVAFFSPKSSFAVARYVYGNEHMYAPDMAREQVPTDTPKLLFKGATLSELTNVTFYAYQEGVSASAGWARSYFTHAYPAEGEPQFLVTTIQRSDDKYIKGVVLKLTQGADGVYGQRIEAPYWQATSDRTSTWDAVKITEDGQIVANDSRTGTYDYQFTLVHTIKPLPDTRQLVFANAPDEPTLTVDDLRNCQFSGWMQGSSIAAPFTYVQGRNLFFTEEDGEVKKIRMELQILDGPKASDTYLKCVVVELTNGEGGVYAQSVKACYASGNTAVGFQFLDEAGNLNSGAKVGAIAPAMGAAGYGVAGLTAKEVVNYGRGYAYGTYKDLVRVPQSRTLVFPGAALSELADVTFYAYSPSGNAYAMRYAGIGQSRFVHAYPDADNPEFLVTAIQRYDDGHVKATVVKLTEWFDGVYAEELCTPYYTTSDATQAEAHDFVNVSPTGVITYNCTNQGAYKYSFLNTMEFVPAAAPRLLFANAEGAEVLTVDDLRDCKFTGCFAGGNVALNVRYATAIGQNPHFEKDNQGKVSKIRVEMQVMDDIYLKCVVVELTNGDGGVWGQAVNACYVDPKYNPSLGFNLLNDDGTLRENVSSGKPVSTFDGAGGYSIAGLVATPTNTKSLTLDRSMTWSELVGDERSVKDNELVIDLDVTVDATLTFDVPLQANTLVVRSVAGCSVVFAAMDGVLPPDVGTWDTRETTGDVSFVGFTPVTDARTDCILPNAASTLFFGGSTNGKLPFNETAVKLPCKAVVLGDGAALDAFSFGKVAEFSVAGEVTLNGNVTGRGTILLTADTAIDFAVGVMVADSVKFVLPEDSKLPVRSLGNTPIPISTESVTGGGSFVLVQGVLTCAAGEELESGLEIGEGGVLEIMVTEDHIHAGYVSSARLAEGGVIRFVGPDGQEVGIGRAEMAVLPGTDVVWAPTEEGANTLSTDGNWSSGTAPESGDVVLTDGGFAGGATIALAAEQTFGVVTVKSGSTLVFTANGGRLAGERLVIGANASVTLPASAVNFAEMSIADGAMIVFADAGDATRCERLAVNGTLDLRGNALTVASFVGSGVITDTAVPTEDGRVGEFHIDIPETETFVFPSVGLAGQLKVVKDGKGVLTTGTRQNENVGGWEIAAGTVKAGGNVYSTHPFGVFKSTITIHEGATYDLNGQVDSRNYHFILDGGTIANTGKDVLTTSGCMGKITLTKNSSLNVAYSFPIWDKVDLNGYNLDIAIGDDKTLGFFYHNSTTDVSAGCSLTNGTVNITSGGWIQPYVKSSGDVIDARTVDFTVNAAFNLSSDLSVRNLTVKYDYDSKNGSGNVNVYGVFTPSEGNYINNFVLQDGATLNLSNQTDVYDLVSPLTGKTLGFADGATIGVKLGAKKRGKIVAWETRPDASVKFVVPKGSGCWLDVRNDGLYACQGLLMVFR